MKLVSAVTMSISTLLISSCYTAPGSNDCKDQLVAKLKSPSSLKIVKESSSTEDVALSKARKNYFLPDSVVTHTNGKMVTIRRTTIEYDADNSYGASLRDTEYCQFVDTSDGPQKIETNFESEDFKALIEG